MSFLLSILLLVILFACMAMLYTDGMWSNAIRLINVVTAALLATNFFEPVARWLDDSQPSYTYVWDFLALWGLFALFMVVFTLVTDRVSWVKVRFLKVADRIGSALFALVIGWVMICFAMMTLHTAPLSETFLFGGFNYQERMFAGLAPDRQWLGFVQRESRGPLCKSATPAEWDQQKYVFDPHDKFMNNYAARRAQLESNIATNDTIRIRP